MTGLSYSQRRLWFFHCLEGPSSTYNMPFAMRLDGDLNEAALHEAFQDILGRHESLRTIYHEIAGEPIQRVVSESALSFEIERVVTGATQLQDAAREACMRPFELEKVIPFRAHLISPAGGSPVLVVVIHHIAADGWSIGPLARDLTTAYACRRNAESPQWTPQHASYLEYAEWQREWMATEHDPQSGIGRQAEYWRERFADGVPEIPLPGEKARARSATGSAGQVRFQVDRATSDRLLLLAAEMRATLYIMLHAAICVLLHRMGCGSDIVVGCTVAGRAEEAFDEIVGLFVNTVALRATVDARSSFRAFLANVRRDDLEAFSNQDLPFERVVEIVNPPRATTQLNPMWRVSLSLESDAPLPFQFEGITVTPYAVDLPMAKVDLAFIMQDPGGPTPNRPLEGTLLFATDIIDDTTAAYLVERLCIVLKAVTDAPDEPIFSLDVLGSSERTRIVKEWNTNKRLVGNLTLAQRFEHQAMLYSSRAAVIVEGDRSLSFAELNAEASALAHWMRERDIGPESFVAIHMARSASLVVAILATLKAGAAFLPIDPAYPDERIAFMLDDAQPALILSNGIGCAALAQAPCTVTAYDDSFRSALAGAACGAITPAPNALSHPAYVIYTSGSTGRPKGVVVCQGSIVNYIDWALRSYYEGIDGGSPLIHSISFDGGLTTLFGPLLSGQTLTMSSTGDELAELMRHPAGAPHALVKMTPSHLKMLNQMSSENAASLLTHALMLGGESLVPSDIVTWQRRNSSLRLINHFGPTETTVGCCTSEITQDLVDATSIPIGRPIDNTQLYVLDDYLMPVAAGVTGDLYVAGDGLARGYLGKPGLTAERFVANPLGDSGTRMYHTGDRVRWSSKGELEFIARIDSQVKVRGFRVELAEVEAAIGKHDAVAQVVVVAAKYSSGGLIAYVVWRDSPIDGDAALIKEAHLRRMLTETLPYYMVPSAFVAMDVFPLTANGKLDRNSLPMPSAAQGIAAAPSSAREAAIAAIFSEILSVDRIGVHDDFFGLGGHSLLVIRLVARLNEAMDMTLSIRDVFNHPTIAGIAKLPTPLRRLSADTRQESRPVRPPLSFSQHRLWFLHKLYDRDTSYNVPRVLSIRGNVDHDSLALAIGDVMTRHEVLRTIIRHEGDDSWQEVQPFVPVTIPFERIVTSQESIQGHVSRSLSHVFDLECELPVRITLIEAGHAQSVLVLLLHHIACDGWSMGVLARELTSAYAARRMRRAPSWEPLALQYVDYSIMQRRRLDGGGESLDYWRQQLAGIPSVLSLPVDRQRPTKASGRGHFVEFEIDGDTHTKLIARARRGHASFFMLAHAALAALLYRLSGERNIVIGTPVAGRTNSMFEGLIGLFINTLVLRTPVSGSMKFDELLALARHVDLDAYEHQETPFEQIVEALNPERSAAYHTLYQVSLLMQDNEEALFDFGGLDVSEEAVSFDVARMDLTFILGRGAGLADGEPLRGQIGYATDLFDEPTIRRIACWYCRVLSLVANEPVARLDAMNIAGTPETKEMPGSLKVEHRHVDGRPVHRLFEERVALHPSAVAVVATEGSLTYAQLNAKSNQLARYLINRGAAPDDIVAIAMPRGVATMVCILGVMKAGAAYLPMDMDSPAKRLRHMLESARPTCVLTSASCDLGSFSQQAVHVIDAPGVQQEISTLSDCDLGIGETRARIHSEHMAYIMFTSGSTGSPKGVIIRHRGLCNYLQWLTATHYADEWRDSPIVHSMGFDGGVTTLFGPLLTGGAVRMLTAGEEVSELMRSQSSRPFGLVKMTPSHFALATEILGHENHSFSAHAIMLGGEALNPHDIAIWQQRYPAIKFVNHFGPTEVTVGCSTLDYVPDARGLHAIPIGRPIWNTRLYILDDRLAPQLTGVPGELYVGGAGLARGYLGAPGLTATRFVADPFGTGDLLYRTGDIVRIGSTGDLEYLGRADGQIKLSGARVDLSEINAALIAAVGGAQAVTVARAAPGGAPQLVSYVAWPDPASFDEHAVQRLLRDTLPPYMCPVRIVALANMPLTAHGKIDLKELPSADASIMADRYQEPEPGRESVIAAIWRDLFRVTRVSRYDNFFALGGHSFLAMSMLDRLRKQGLGTDLRAVFVSASLAELAMSCRSLDGAMPDGPHLALAVTDEPPIVIEL